ncbi:type II toxin-antitoxin system VapC family toxin [Thermus filiformis]|uniref:Ribonuclease VapC n=1 Tax=Thermus filiformis TaxID=276 RepID=A0A0A2XD35_THEFI|nr:type II toxin-antitoxin system VapC family toxin [Thermus filiformis]KGQ23064.2 plasmid stabilization protein [Thermus filiformis]
MILLDTNVLSEFIRPRPAEQVVAWLDRQSPEEVWVSAISRAEMELGLALMPEGKRKAALVKAVRAMFEEDFAGRCLPFDEVAALQYGRIVASRQREGRPISVEDAQIAAIALAHRMALATRNLADFAGIQGLSLINPWEA